MSNVTGRRVPAVLLVRVAAEPDLYVASRAPESCPGCPLRATARAAFCLDTASSARFQRWHSDCGSAGRSIKTF
jgi:TPP-dependent indolepyruvate ferredoxin oxidoreductase alpha subunit